MIAEIMLVSEGFKDFKPLARKMISMYSIMVQQMSKQDHYDFGSGWDKLMKGWRWDAQNKERDHDMGKCPS